MIILSGDYLVTCNKKFEVLKNSAICFDEIIIDIDSTKELIKKYPDAKVISCSKNSVILPGLINTHIHLEFYANKTTLKYGNFIEWLSSVIKYRDKLIAKCDENSIDNVLDDILKSGTTSIGAISSFGLDLNSCVKSKLNVVYFNEILGSNPNMIDSVYEEFLDRFELSCQKKSKNFIPAISIHAPYSTHPDLAKKALLIAKEQDLVVSTHFLESKAEREWLESGSGEFKSFFDLFFPDAKALHDIDSYIDLFKNIKTIFTHVVFANEKEFERIEFISHCPTSNRLLSNSKFKFKNSNLKVTIGSDGLSSNISLNLWDELRVALFIHNDSDLNLLSKNLLIAATRNGALALGLNSGSLDIGKDADIITVQLPDVIEHEEDLITQMLLHTQKAQNLFIGGKKII